MERGGMASPAPARVFPFALTNPADLRSAFRPTVDEHQNSPDVSNFAWVRFRGQIFCELRLRQCVRQFKGRLLHPLEPLGHLSSRHPLFPDMPMHRQRTRPIDEIFDQPLRWGVSDDLFRQSGRNSPFAVELSLDVVLIDHRGFNFPVRFSKYPFHRTEFPNGSHRESHAQVQMGSHLFRATPAVSRSIAAKFPVIFPDRWEFRRQRPVSGDCVRHQPVRGNSSDFPGFASRATFPWVSGSSLQSPRGVRALLAPVPREGRPKSLPSGIPFPAWLRWRHQLASSARQGPVRTSTPRAGAMIWGLIRPGSIDPRRRRLKAQDSPLLGPEHRRVDKPGSVEAARQPPLDRRLDEVRREKSERQRHPDRSFALVLASGERRDGHPGVGEKLVKPSMGFRERLDEDIPRPNAHRAPRSPWDFLRRLNDVAPSMLRARGPGND